jgi:hypothetical protein
LNYISIIYYILLILLLFNYQTEDEKLKNQKDKLKIVENKKSYRRWKQLLKSEKYISSINGEIKTIPNIKIANHDSKWKYTKVKSSVTPVPSMYNFLPI